MPPLRPKGRTQRDAWPFHITLSDSMYPVTEMFHLPIKQEANFINKKFNLAPKQKDIWLRYQQIECQAVNGILNSMQEKNFNELGWWIPQGLPIATISSRVDPL